ncbi:putative ABC transport system permease protein [Pseudonocardia hierapolitana]|uniref:Putative ABC transport system permease protein n=1 Tax=Pseudonocardia hierapolitana TaxID=1128676 RepID=A0A561T4H5_9PSEU|nr:ABC transporter permease [Pseudonocardia hierapolitana]TWF82008.1 putative ABC transport system permease protein [Pseudonocardia hierapolitana]
MRTVLLASLRIHVRRYVAAGIAVIASVAFVVVIGVLTSGARAGFMENSGAPYRGADFVVDAPEDGPEPGPPCCPDTLDLSDAIALIDRLGDNASGLGRVDLPAHREDGAPLGSGEFRGQTTVGPIAAGEGLRWQKLVSGRFPAHTGEAVMHVWDAQAQEVAVGDRIRVGDGSGATDLEVVGLVVSPTTWTQASMYVTWPQYLQWRDQPTFHVGSVAVRGEVGPLPEGMRVWTADEYVRNGLTRLNNDTDMITLMLLLFAGVALVVSVLVVANTFSILFAGRLRDFALLRCVGATRAQVLGSVRREAAAVGGLASLAGALVGVGLGYGLLPLINTLAPTPLAAPAPPVPWLLGGFAVGLLVTMLASWLPTRQVIRVSPLAALRPPAALDVRTATGRVRLALAALLLLTGPALLAAAMVRDSTLFMVAGGAAVFTGVLLVGPVLVPRLVRVSGALLGRAGRLATQNAVRDPRRTATTTAALLVGATLTTAVLTGMATWRAGLDEVNVRHNPIDAALTSLEEPVPTDLLDRVRRTPGVEQAIAVDGAVARLSGFDAPLPVLTTSAAPQVARDGGSFAQVEPGTIRLDLDAFTDPSVRPGDQVTVRVGDREARLRVVSLSGWGRAGMLAPQTLAQLTDAPEPRVVWVRATAGADPLKLVDDLDGLADAAGAQLEDRLQAQAAANRERDLLAGSALGLLGVSVAIALIGIGNTLGLSVLERAREHALLRALGLTRGQLRRTLAAEALLLSVVATVLGTLIGVGFAWVGYETFVKRALTHATMVIPWPSLGAVVLIATLAGLLAAVLPAHRAARVSPAEGLSLD